MKSKVYLGCAALAAIIAVSAASSTVAATVYTINQTIGGGSVVGSITTDGKTGVLAGFDITAWDLKLTGIGASYNLKNTDPNSGALVVGGDLTATTNGLYFNFSGTSGDFFLIQDNVSSGSTYYCDSVGLSACLAGKSDVPQYYTDPSAQFDHAASGNQLIGVAGVPEPATWAMILLGVGLTGAGLRIARRKNGTAFTVA